MVANSLFMDSFPKCLPSAHARASSRARHWLMDGVNDTLFNAAPNVQLAMAQNIAVMLTVVSSTQKKMIELKANPMIKNTSKFIKLKRNWPIINEKLYNQTFEFYKATDMR